MRRVRTFIALDPGEGIRDRVIALQESLARTDADVKWVEPDNLHLTLLFLGEVDHRDLVPVCRAVDAVAQETPAFELSLAGAGAFPNLRRPRILWIGVSNGVQETCALHDALEPPLLELGCYRREDRPYTPHLTLGRLHGDKPADQLAAALQKKQDYQAGTTIIREVHVMSSELSSKGPVYTVMSRAKLAI